MGSTYTWQNAIDHVAKYVKGVPTTALDAVAADTVDNIIWKFWFWKWSMKNLTPISWVDQTQDYTISNSDFYRLYRLRFRRTDITPNIVREKNVTNFLSPNLEQKGTIDSILSGSYNYELGLLRLEKATSVPSGLACQIEGDYQFQKTKITSASTTIVFPDYYFDVAIEGIKWKYYQLIGSQQAGMLQLDKKSKQVVYTGQLGVFYASLQAMAEAEGMGQGDSTRFPDDGLGSARVTNPGLFAWS